uniref:Uncharacterized protein n=1 Tax=Panagrolaimus sp. JU765 TaxID=591449 RepID=A0AC34QU07_9BILA
MGVQKCLNAHQKEIRAIIDECINEAEQAQGEEAKCKILAESVSKLKYIGVTVCHMSDEYWAKLLSVAYKGFNYFFDTHCHPN